VANAAANVAINANPQARCMSPPPEKPPGQYRIEGGRLLQ